MDDGVLVGLSFILIYHSQDAYCRAETDVADGLQHCKARVASNGQLHCPASGDGRRWQRANTEEKQRAFSVVRAALFGPSGASARGDGSSQSPWKKR